MVSAIGEVGYTTKSMNFRKVFQSIRKVSVAGGQLRKQVTSKSSQEMLPRQIEERQEQHKKEADSRDKKMDEIGVKKEGSTGQKVGTPPQDNDGGDGASKTP